MSGNQMIHLRVLRHQDKKIKVENLCRLVCLSIFQRVAADTEVNIYMLSSELD